MNTAGNIFFDEMAPKQLGTWVRYIKVVWRRGR
jgi:hypothetical protein